MGEMGASESLSPSPRADTTNNGTGGNASSVFAQLASMSAKSDASKKSRDSSVNTPNRQLANQAGMLHLSVFPCSSKPDCRLWLLLHRSWSSGL